MFVHAAWALSMVIAVLVFIVNIVLSYVSVIT